MFLLIGGIFKGNVGGQSGLWWPAWPVVASLARGGQYGLSLMSQTCPGGLSLSRLAKPSLATHGHLAQ